MNVHYLENPAYYHIFWILHKRLHAPYGVRTGELCKYINHLSKSFKDYKTCIFSARHAKVCIVSETLYRTLEHHISLGERLQCLGGRVRNTWTGQGVRTEASFKSVTKTVSTGPSFFLTRFLKGIQRNVSQNNPFFVCFPKSLDYTLACGLVNVTNHLNVFATLSFLREIIFS